MTNVKRTREDILEAVLELIHRQGFQATGLKALFTASKTSSGSFYNYFRSKDELAHALIDFKWQKIQTNFSKITTDANLNALDKVFALIDLMEASHTGEIDCSGCFLGNLIVDLVEHNATFRSHLITVFDQWHGLLAQQLKLAKNQLKPNVNPEHLAEQILTIMEGTLLLNRLYEQGDRLKRGFALMRDTVKNAQA